MKKSYGVLQRPKGDSDSNLESIGTMETIGDVENTTESESSTQFDEAFQQLEQTVDISTIKVEEFTKAKRSNQSKNAVFEIIEKPIIKNESKKARKNKILITPQHANEENKLNPNLKPERISLGREFKSSECLTKVIYERI